MSAENHMWFNQQSEEAKEEINRKFQEYKKCNVVLDDCSDLEVEVKTMTFEIPDKKSKKRFNRARENREFRKRCEEEWEL